MSAIVSPITGVPIVCSSGRSGADQRKHQSSASLAFVRGIHRWPVDPLRKGPVNAEKSFHLMTSSWLKTPWGKIVPCHQQQLYWLHRDQTDPSHITQYSVLKQNIDVEKFHSSHTKAIFFLFIWVNIKTNIDREFYSLFRHWNKKIIIIDEIVVTGCTDSQWRKFRQWHWLFSN